MSEIPSNNAGTWLVISRKSREQWKVFVQTTGSSVAVTPCYLWAARLFDNRHRSVLVKVQI